MANSTATHSYSTTLGLDPTGGSSFVAVAEVTHISGPGYKVTSVDRTNLNSPSRAREFVSGFIDAGQATFTCRWTKAEYAILLSHLGTNLMNWKLTFPLVGAEVTASNIAWFGHIEELGTEVPEDDVINNDVTVKISGLPVFVAGS